MHSSTCSISMFFMQEGNTFSHMAWAQGYPTQWHNLGYSRGFTGYAAGGCGLTGCTGWTGCTTATGSVAVGADPVKRGREELDFLTANTQSCFRQHMTKGARQYGYQTHWRLSGTSDNACACWLTSTYVAERQSMWLYEAHCCGIIITRASRVPRINTSTEGLGMRLYMGMCETFLVNIITVPLKTVK